MYKKKDSRRRARLAAEAAVLRDLRARRIHDAAARPVPEVLKDLNTTLRGLSREDAAASRAEFGANRITRRESKSLLQRISGAFLNPFTAILLFLALISAMTDMLFP